MYTTDNLSGVPVYEQIVRQTEAFILAGIMPPDAPMPSVRAVATEIAANPNTVQKAYTHLLSRGILYAVPGKGSFISPDAREAPRRIGKKAPIGRGTGFPIRRRGHSQAGGSRRGRKRLRERFAKRIVNSE